jgi:hypothetical protein
MCIALLYSCAAYRNATPHTLRWFSANKFNDAGLFCTAAHICTPFGTADAKYTARAQITTNDTEEDVMRALITTIIGTIAPVTAFAASTPHIDNSGLFSWIFLGFCSLIVLMQVMPAILMMVGMAKGLKEVMTPAHAAAKK